MASASSGAAAFSRLVDRTRVPDPTLQRHAVAAFFRHLLTLRTPLPAAAHDGISSLASPHAAVAAHASCVLRSGPAGSRFPPHNHPFVQALASGADGARAELSRQAARMVAEGLDGVVGFLRPFVMFAVVRKGDAAFSRDLIGAPQRQNRMPWFQC